MYYCYYYYVTNSHSVNPTSKNIIISRKKEKNSGLIFSLCEKKSKLSPNAYANYVGNKISFYLSIHTKNVGTYICIIFTYNKIQAHKSLEKFIVLLLFWK